MRELFPSQLHPPPILFPNAIVLFLKSSFVLIVLASSWQLTHLSPTVLKKMSWSCSPKHSPDVYTELKHICNDSFHLGVKLFLKQWQPHQSDFRWIYQKEKPIKKTQASATSSKVPGCSSVKTLNKVCLKNCQLHHACCLRAIPHKGCWENESAFRAALHPKSHSSVLNKPPAQGDPMRSLRSMMVVSGETLLENYCLFHVSQERQKVSR